MTWVKEQIKEIRAACKQTKGREQILAQLRFWRKYNINLTAKDTREMSGVIKRLVRK